MGLFRDRPILDRLRNGTRAVVDVLFAPGSERVLQPAREGQPALVEQTPKGILRSKTVITLLVGLIYTIARSYGWEPPAGMGEVEVVDKVVTVVDLIVAGFFRTNASVPTRGY